jgi:aminoglycoside phosphotransferase (APT) family kinase protein
MHDPRVDVGNRTVLEELVSQLDTLELRWTDVEVACAGVPSTLVHGDFRPKNLRLREAEGATSILPLDWEFAGWGLPCRDISDVPVDVYWSVVHESWPDLTLQDIWCLANIGKLFEWVTALNWETASLITDPTEKAMRNMTVCRAWLASAMELAFWKGST